MSNISLDSTDSDVFYVEQISNEPSPRRNNSPSIFNSTERSEHHERRMPSISTIASPQPHFFTIHDDSNEPTMPYGFGQQHLVPLVWTIWTCHPIPSTSWQPWQWWIPPMMTTTTEIAQNHLTRQCRPQYRRPQWLWVHSEAGRRPIPRRTAILFTQVTSLDESIGISRQIMILALVFQEIHLLRRALVLLRRLQEHRKESWAWECPFQKTGECRSTSAKPAVR